MKRRLFLIFVLASLFFEAFTGNGIDEKIHRTVQAAFPGAQQVTWSGSGADREVGFVCDGLQYRIWFSAKGTPGKVFRSGEKNFLPPYINLLLQKKYGDKSFFGMKEFMSDEEITYEIILQDDMYWYHILSDAYGNFRIYSKMFKAK